ncbi:MULTISPECIES: LysR family transcriptional regulator [Cobetia]|uniref:LysR family transcriptional regulator n=1 Tax=Cobetia crustatorum TaxID=553385 RepID=A0A558HN77_9GAMM|nr:MULTISPECIES: LysR family transcriptional regulator [Cobetia]TVU70590.1 LysR family transcriptional regulator [Cobetia crustatorum]
MHLAELARHDLNTLVALHALLETRSVSRAAERLNLSQPAVSRTLGRLREAFDDPLFVRAQRGLRPTARAEALQQPLARLLQALGALLAPPEFFPADSQRRFQLATTDYGMHAFVAPQIAPLHREAPNVRLDIQAYGGNVEQQLDEGGPELAMCVPTAKVPAGVHGREIGADHFVCVMRKDHPLATKPTLSLDDFLVAGHQLISMGGDERGAVDLALAEQGLSRQVVLRQPHFLAAFSVTCHSDLLLCVPGCLAASMLEQLPLTIRPLPIDINSFSYWLVWHERLHHDAGHSWLRQRLSAGIQVRHRELTQRLRHLLNV